MGFGKFINLDEESFKIWKERFGSYSQEFSKWVCDKLKEENLQNMGSERKKEYIQEREKRIKQESEFLEIEKKELQIKEKIEKKEMKDKNKVEEELKKKKSEKEEKIKENFFEYAEDQYKLKEGEIEKLFKEFKKQEGILAIVPFLKNKFERNVKTNK